MSSRARYAYVPDKWPDLLEKQGLTHSELASIIGVEQRHIYNIASGHTKHARFKTVKKVVSSLRARGVPNNIIDELFTKA